MEELVPIIIFLIIIFSSGIKKVLQLLAKKIAAQDGQPRGEEATPDRIREFLERMQGVERQPQQPVPQPGRARAEAEPAAAWEAGEFAPFAVEVQQEPARELPAQPLQPEVQVPPQIFTRKRPRPKKRVARTRRPEPTARAQEPKETTPAAPSRPRAIKDWDLKQAVIWSEILGRPVSRRRHFGHRPPTITQ